MTTKTVSSGFSLLGDGRREWYPGGILVVSPQARAIFFNYTRCYWLLFKQRPSFEQMVIFLTMAENQIRVRQTQH